MQKKSNVNLILFLSFLALLFSCKAKKEVAKPIVLPEKTAFYTFEAIRDTVNKTTHFTLLKATVVDTKINYTEDNGKAKNPDFLKFEITDKNHKTISAYTEHPLFKKFDLYSDSGEITSKLISLQKAQITIRIPFFAHYNLIKITETINFKITTTQTIKQ